MNAISKAFGGVSVLENVGFDVARGEVVALLGGNGAGKSTLMKILSGVYHGDAGQICIDGKTVDITNPSDAARLGICLLPQEISIMPDMTVAENISLAAIPTKTTIGLRVIDREAMKKKARDLLSQLGFAAIDPNSLVASLSVAERRVVEIARALAAKANILIMDEPTAALTELEAQKIFQIIRRLKEQSTAIIYISHYLKEVFEISDRVVVLRDGRNAGEFVTKNSSPEEVVEAMLGAKSTGLFEPQRVTMGERETMLDVRELGFGRHLQG
ncbi:MAG: ATP-binding cassette domain-containing protein, partial [Pseudomonadota bacterium]|nr:ATP-binding cassette domain-containing protein [Pseudomonadota bacterium]